MEQEIERKNTAKNNLNYVQDDMEEDPLNTDDDPLDIKIEEKDYYNNSGVENDALETSEGTLENFSCNLDYLKVNPFKVVTPEVSQVLQKSSELEILNSNVTLSVAFDVDTAESDRHKEILLSDDSKKRKRRNIGNNKCNESQKQHGQFACTKCEYTTSTMNYLKVHEAVHSDGRPYRCTKCGYSSKYRSNLCWHKNHYHEIGNTRQRKKKKHITTQKKGLSSVVLHNVKPYGYDHDPKETTHCGDSFSDLKLPRTHEVTSKCENSRVFEIKSPLSENQKELHNKREEDVSFLDSIISQPTQNYDSNNKSKSSKKLYRCKLCKFCTKIKSHLLDHESFHTDKRPYTCLKCNFSSKYRSNLNRHKKICSGAKIRGIKLKNKNRKKCTSIISSDKSEFHEFGTNLSHDNIFRNDQNSREKSSQQKHDIDGKKKKRNLSWKFNRRSDHNLKPKINAEMAEVILNSDSQNLNYNKTEEEFEKDETKETLQKFHSDGDESSSRNESNTNLSSFRKNSKEIRGKFGNSYKIKDLNNKESLIGTGSKPYKCSNCNFRTKWKLSYIRHKNTKVCFNNNKPEFIEDGTMRSTSSIEKFSDEFGKNVQVRANNKTPSELACILRCKDSKQKNLRVPMDDHFISSKPSENDNYIESMYNSKITHKCIHCGNSFSDLKLLRIHKVTSKCKGSRELEIQSSISETQKERHHKHHEDVSLPDSNISQPTEKYKRKYKLKSRKRIFKKLYRCKLCKFRTKIKFNFIDHESFHTGERPYTCLKCNSSFKYRSNLFSHNKKCSDADKFGRNGEESASNIISLEQGFFLRSKKSKPKNLPVEMGNHLISNKPSEIDNYTEINKENTGGEVYSNSSDVNMDANQSNEVDIDAELFKYFPSNFENSYGDEALIQIFFQKPKVLLEKLKLYFCATCDFVSHSSSKLETHKYETHLRSKMYECSECNYTSVTWRDLKKHEVTHQSGKSHSGKSICHISFNKRYNEKEEEEDTCVTMSIDNDDEEDTCMTLSSDNEEEDSSITPSTSENLGINMNEVASALSHNFSTSKSDFQVSGNNDESDRSVGNYTNRQSENELQAESSLSNELFSNKSSNNNDDIHVHPSITSSTLGNMQTRTKKAKNILSQNNKDSESNYQVPRKKDKSNKKVENIDLLKLREIIGEVFNDKATSLLSNILGTEITQKMLRKNTKLSTNVLESFNKLENETEIERSQSDHDVDKPVDKTSYDYVRKAVELYKKSVDDSEEDKIDSNDIDLITQESTLKDLDPSFKNTVNTSKLALGSLAAKSKNINLPIVRPTHPGEPSSGKLRPVIVEKVPENYRMLNIPKPLPRHNINTMDKASTSVCENLASNNYVNAQELPRWHSNNSSLVNTNKSFNSDSNSGRLQFPSNLNINVAVAPSSAVYSNRELTRETSFPSMSGIAGGSNNFLRAAPVPLISQNPLLTNQISDYSPSYINNASGLHGVIEMEGYDIPVDHAMKNQQDPVRLGEIPLVECQGKSFSLDNDFIFRCSKCNYITNVKAFFSRHYLEMHVGKKNT